MKVSYLPMNSILGLSIPVQATAQLPTPAVSAKPPKSKRIAAVLLSIIVPGTGQLLLGHIRAAALFLAGFAAALAFFWPLRLPASYLGLVISLLLLFTVSLTAAGHVLRSADQNSPNFSLWWLLLVLPMSYLAACLQANPALRVAGFQLFSIPSSAMENTLIVGDRIIVDRRYYRAHKPRVGEVAVFRRGNLWEVKRIMAAEGDKLFGRAGLVYRNDARLWEPYVVHLGISGDAYMNDFGPITVPAGEVFVMGDNRDVSYDSRQPEHGPVSLGGQSGKPLYIVWSRDHRRIGRLVR